MLMADDLLQGILGGDDEKSEAEAPEAVAGAEAFAMAVAARLSAGDPEVARDTSAFLKKQAHLLDLQARHLEEEHASRLAHLRLAVGAARRKRYADVMRNALYTCGALLLLGVVIAAVRMTYEAISDHGLVVEDFTVPADFAARGVTSQALAADLASRVATIRTLANNHSLTYTNDVRTTQAATLEVQIPETGISVDELEHFLHRWLGHQTVVNGELREEAADQLSLVLHIAGADPVVVSGPGAQLDELMQRAAEQAFAVFDPVNHIIYLGAVGRPQEGYDAARRLAGGTSLATASQDRSDAYALLAGFDPDRHRAVEEARVAIDTDPRELVAWMWAARASRELGHDGAAVNYAHRWIATRRQDQPTRQRDAYAWLIASGHEMIDEATGDFAAVGEDYEGMDRRSGISIADGHAERAQVAALLHDEASAGQQLALALASGPANAGDVNAAAGESTLVLQARWDVSAAAGEWARALQAAEALVSQEEAAKAAAPRPEYASGAELALATQYGPLLALAKAMTGDTASATALISQTPTDCYLCVRIRAKVAAAAGDVATADRWFAEAVRQAPDLPMGYFEWGQALLARGDLAGAARELALAHAKGPHFADALKVWGDVLVKQAQSNEALAKYDEALTYAPHWSALKHARDAAAGDAKT
jgi:tetratricopeptide (TPR) repeat protein